MQQTISKEVQFEGVGIHSGELAKINVLPNRTPDAGITFKLGESVVEASYAHFCNRKLCTSLMQGDAEVKTVEHLMAALFLTGVTNAVIEVVSGNEIPIMDGSAKDFISGIENAGIDAIDAKRKVIKVLSKVRVDGTDGAFIEIHPNNSGHLKIDYKISFPHPMIGEQAFSFTYGESRIEEIAAARSFGAKSDLDYLHSQGLALGASLENVIGLGEKEVLNDGGLRWSDEFVRHKILDCLGDLAIAPALIIGDVTAYKAGHFMHNKLIHALLSDDSAYVSE